MGYSPTQLRALAGMGLVPWVLRGQQVASTNLLPQSDELPAVLEEPTQSKPVEATQSPSLLQTPLVSIPFRGQHCTLLGNEDARLLVLIEAISTQQTQYPFEPSDAKIFEDMLRSIAWRRQDVCLAVLPPTVQGSLMPSLIPNEQSPCVDDLCRVPREAALLFRHQLPDSLKADDLRVTLKGEHLHAWQLPHPALLRESPQRKRQAWEVLKAARARLRS